MNVSQISINVSIKNYIFISTSNKNNTLRETTLKQLKTDITRITPYLEVRTKLYKEPWFVKNHKPIGISQLLS